MEEEDIFSALEQLKAKANGTAQEIREIVNELHAVCAALESADPQGSWGGQVIEQGVDKAIGYLDRAVRTLNQMG